MIKRQLYKILILPIIVLIGVSICIGLRNSRTITQVNALVDDSNMKYQFLSFYNEFFSNNVTTDTYNNEVSCLADLENISDYIMLATPITRCQQSSLFITEFQIKKVFKGKYTQKNFFMFEPTSLMKDNSSDEYKMIIPMGWYLPVIEGEQYLLFLNRVDAYGHDDLFTMVSNPYAKVPLKEVVRVGNIDNRKASIWLNKETYSTFDIAFPTNFIQVSLQNGQQQDYSYVKTTYMKIIDEAYWKYFNQTVTFEEVDIGYDKNLLATNSE